MSGPGVLALPPNPWWLRWPALLPTVTVGLAVAATAIELVRVIAKAGGPFPLVGVLLACAAAFGVLRLPWVGLAGAVVGCGVAAASGWDPIVEWTIVVFVLFTATLRGARPLWMVLAAVVAIYLITTVERGDGYVSTDALAAVVACVAGGAAGSAIWTQQRYWRTLRAHAQEAIVTREAEARRRVEAERLRIARDLHDVVGHQIAIASMHVGVVEVTAERDAAAATRAAAEARKALRTVTAETQQILELLRSREARDDAVAGVSFLSTLIASYRAIGLIVSDRVQAPTGDVAPVVDITAYRVVQEALTNAHRYGNGRVDVRVVAEGDRLLIDVENPVDQQPGRDHGSGFGLIGVRERVAAAGGIVDVRDDGDRFHVRVELALNGRALR